MQGFPARRCGRVPCETLLALKALGSKVKALKISPVTLRFLHISDGIGNLIVQDVDIF